MQLTAQRLRNAAQAALVAAVAFTFAPASTRAQTAVPPSPAVTTTTAAGSFNGKWTYRSYVNDPDLTVPPNTLLFGRATIDLTETDGSVSGTIGGPGWSLALTGAVTYSGNAATIKVQGVGDVGGETWVYDYFGYLAPSWANGVDQRPAIVGTVVRTVTHSNGQAPAGVVVSFIAVKQ